MSSSQHRVKIDGVDAGYAKVIPPRPFQEGLDSADPWIRLISGVMDTAFRLPGTKVRFGIDPLIGMFPGVGDGASAVVSVFLIGMSARYGLPKIVLARMALNALVNGVVGTVPFAGDLFSFWFKSNVANYELLRKHAGPRRASTTGDWIFVGGLIALVLLGIFLALLGMWTLLSGFFRWIF